MIQHRNSPLPWRDAGSRGYLCALSCAAFGLILAPAPRRRWVGNPETSQQPRPAATADAQPMWRINIEPFLEQKAAFKCHGSSKQKGGWIFASRKRSLERRDGWFGVIAGRPLDSPLFQRIQPGADQHMPPRPTKCKLSTEEISTSSNGSRQCRLPGQSFRDHRQGTSISAQSAPSLIEQAGARNGNPGRHLQPTAGDPDFLIESHWRDQHISGNGNLR